MTHHRGNQGVVLVIVIFFALLLTTSIATFLKRSTIDYMISRHREDAAQAEAVARGQHPTQPYADDMEEAIRKSMPPWLGDNNKG